MSEYVFQIWTYVCYVIYTRLALQSDNDRIDTPF